MNELIRLRQAIGSALTVEQQVFVSANLTNFLSFCETDKGKAALAAFVSTWEDKPPTQ